MHVNCGDCVSGRAELRQGQAESGCNRAFKCRLTKKVGTTAKHKRYLVGISTHGIAARDPTLDMRGVPTPVRAPSPTHGPWNGR